HSAHHPFPTRRSSDLKWRRAAYDSGQKHMSWSSYPLGRNMGRPLMNGDAISPSPTTAMDATMLSPLATCREIPLSWCQTFSRMLDRKSTRLNSSHVSI